MLLLGILCAFWALPAVLSLGLYPRLDPPLYGYNPFNVSIIPLTKIGCTHPHLNATEVYKAKEKLVDWGKKGKIPAGGIRGQYSGDAAAWICNCKHFYRDHAPAAEIEEAFRVIQQNCHGLGGWVYSHKWQKSWNFGATKKMFHLWPGSSKCPQFCLWGWMDPQEKYWK